MYCSSRAQAVITASASWKSSGWGFPGWMSDIQHRQQFTVYLTLDCLFNAVWGQHHSNTLLTTTAYFAFLGLFCCFSCRQTHDCVTSSYVFGNLWVWSFILDLWSSRPSFNKVFEDMYVHCISEDIWGRHTTHHFLLSYCTERNTVYSSMAYMSPDVHT